MHFIDTNIFIRHITKDDPKKAEACFNFFQKAEREEAIITTSEAVITEVVYILSSKNIYKLPREYIRKILYPLLSLNGMKLIQKDIYCRALDLYVVYPIDFEDALSAAYVEKQEEKEIISYDKDFDKIPTIKRVEP